MTLEQAQEVKDILKTIHDHIPATHVDRIFHYYKSYIDPHAGKPCTCSPKDWNRMLIELKNKVEATLASYEQIQNQPEESTSSKRGRKKGIKTTL
jgi:hypothetical protein